MNPCKSIISYEIESLLEVVKTPLPPPKKLNFFFCICHHCDNKGVFLVISNSVIKYLRFFWHLKPWTSVYILDSRFFLNFEKKKKIPSSNGFLFFNFSISKIWQFFFIYKLFFFSFFFQIYTLKTKENFLNTFVTTMRKFTPQLHFHFPSFEKKKI